MGIAAAVIPRDRGNGDRDCGIPAVMGQRQSRPTGTRGAMVIFCGGGTHGERVEHEPITGVWGQSPQRGPGTESLVRGQGGEAP